jgi:serine/threonine protein kinase
MTCMAEMPGSVVADRYQLVEAIGKGAMGRVWRAHDQLLDREVAVKEIFLPDGLATEERREIVDRAMREAQAAARLNHRGIVTVHDVVLHGGRPWIIMELISGHSLDQAIAGTARLDWVKVTEIGATLADALAHAHAAGIVHRDLKPGNVMLSGSRVVITDFGIARMLDASVRLTASAAIIGTPQYMPPEQLDGHPVQAPGDMWALGATLYTAVEGHPPFDGPSLTAIWAAILTRPLPAAQHAGPLGPVLAELMARAPDQRPEAHVAAARLTALQSYTPTSRNPAGGSPPQADGAATRPRADRLSPGTSHAQLAARYVRSRDVGDAVISVMRFSQDGRLLATHESRLASYDSHSDLMLWDTAADDPPRSFTLSHGPPRSAAALAFCPGGGLLAVSTEGNATIQLLDPIAGMRQRALGVPHDQSYSHHFAGMALSFSADGRLLAAFCTAEPRVWLWDAATGQQKRGPRLKTPAAELLRSKRERNIGAAAFSPDMSLLAIHHHRDTVDLWNPLTGRRQRSISDNYPDVSTIAFGSGDRLLAVRSSDDAIRLWDCDTGQPVLAFKGSRSSLDPGSAAFAFHDRLVATADSPDIQLWDPATGRHLDTLSPPDRARLTADGRIAHRRSPESCSRC